MIKKFLFPILIIALGVAAYANSLNGQFVYDDDLFIKDNSLTHDLSAIPVSFTKNFGEQNGQLTNAYRPLQQVANTLNYAVCKMNVRGYHLVNMILHILAALSVFALVTVLFGNDILGFFTALLFVVHPIQTEAVSYISGRCDPMLLFFLSLSMIIYVKWLQASRLNITALVFFLLSFLGAIFSKEECIVLPLLLLSYHMAFKKKINPVPFGLGLAASVIYLILRYSHLHVLNTSGTDTLFDRLPGFMVAIFTYFKLLFIPIALHMEYGQKLFAWSDPRALGGLAITIAILALAYFQRNNRTVIFGISWFFLSLLPVSNLYKINFYMAEHFLYIPSVGFFLILAYYLNLLYEQANFKILAVVLVTAAVTALTLLTIRQNNYWSTPETFYEMTLKYVQDSPNVYNNLGQIYQDQGLSDKAFTYYSKAIELNPNDGEAYNNRGSLYSEKGDFTSAIADFSKALEINPGFVVVYNNRGSDYMKIHNYDAAIADFNQVISMDPGNITAYNNRGGVFYSEGDYNDAVNDYNKSIELESNADAYCNRGLALDKMGNMDAALADFDKAIELKPSLSVAYLNRGMIYYKKKDLVDTIADFNQALELNPKLDEAYNDLGSVYGNKGDLPQAIEQYNKAIELDPTNSEAYNNRGNVYVMEKDYAHAIESFTKALEISPSAQSYFNRGNAYGNKGSYDKAIEDYSKTIELKPDFGQAYSNRAIAFCMLKDYTKAQQDVDRAKALGANINPKLLEVLKQALGT